MREDLTRLPRGCEAFLRGERVLVPFDDGTAELCITVTADELAFLREHGFVDGECFGPRTARERAKGLGWQVVL